ncbi:MAG: tape measure protein [Campylobacteraceae bacterium]|jgi:tape measure domain-containing protein|nr:tape measure protein [Campylobacteraceae bacterium]
MEKELSVRIRAKNEATSEFDAFRASVMRAEEQLAELKEEEKQNTAELKRLKAELSGGISGRNQIKAQIDEINTSMQRLKTERAALNKTLEGGVANKLGILDTRYANKLIDNSDYGKEYTNIINKGYITKIKSQLDAADKSTTKLTKSTSAFGSILKRVFAFVSVGYLAKQYTELSDTYILMEGRLKLVAKSENELIASEQALFRIAQDTRQSYAQTADLYARIARVTAPLAKSQKDNLQVTEAINKALIISGGSAASASGALIQLGQGFAAGALRGQELNSVMEQTPRLAQMIAEGMGVSIGQLRKLGEEGKLSAEAVYNAIIKESTKVDAEFQKMPKTVGQSIEQVKNSILDLVGYTEKATGSAKGMSDTITYWSEAISNNKEIIVEAGRDAWRALEMMGLGVIYYVELIYSKFLEIILMFPELINAATKAMSDVTNAAVQGTAAGINKIRSLLGKEEITVGEVNFGTNIANGVKEHYENVQKEMQNTAAAMSKTLKEIWEDTTPKELKIDASNAVTNGVKKISEEVQKIIEKTTKTVNNYLTDMHKDGIEDRFDKEIYTETEKYAKMLELEQLSNVQKEQITKAYTEKIERIQLEAQKELLKKKEDAELKYYKAIGDKEQTRAIEQKRFLEEIENLNLSSAQKQELITKEQFDYEINAKIESLKHWEKYYKAIGDSASANLQRIQREVLELKQQGVDKEDINNILQKGNNDTLQSGIGATSSLATELTNRLSLIEAFKSAELERIKEYYDLDEQAARENAEAKAEILRMQFNSAAATASAGFGTMATLAKMFYDASGGKSKEALRAYQALAIAQATMNAYLSASNAYAEAKNPYLGAVMAALAIAQGMAQVVQIKAQKFHTGGYVTGASDEVPAVLQRGEYVVSRQGVNALDNINNGNIGANTSVEVVLLDDRQAFENYVNSRKGSTLIKKVIREG